MAGGRVPTADLIALLGCWCGRRRVRCCARLRLYPIKHAQSRINAGLSGFPVATDNAKLSIAVAHEEMSVPAALVIVSIAHSTPTSIAPIIVPIPMPLPSVTAVLPPPTLIIIISQRALAPC